MLAAAGTSASHAEATSRLVGRWEGSAHVAPCVKEEGSVAALWFNLACNEAACVGNICALIAPCAGRSSVL